MVSSPIRTVATPRHNSGNHTSAINGNPNGNSNSNSNSSPPDGSGLASVSTTPRLFHTPRAAGSFGGIGIGSDALGSKSPYSFSLNLTSPLSNNQQQQRRINTSTAPQQQSHPQQQPQQTYATKIIHRIHHGHSSSTGSMVPSWTLIVLILAFANFLYQWFSKQHLYAGDYGVLSQIAVVDSTTSATGAKTVTLPPTTTTTATSRMHWTPALPLTPVRLEFPFDKPSSSSTTPSTTPVVVFYHIYIPNTDEGRDNSARIIQEQLQQLQTASSTLSKTTFVLYYNTIGELTPHVLDHTTIQQWCQQHAIVCHPMQHYAEGMEDVTLQRLHDFCSLSDNDDNVDQSVIYLHNKGSYTTKPLNEAWRYQMTQAVASEQCHNALSSSGTQQQQQCNLCGLYFSVERGMFMAGNMWHSSCRYISQLIPPRDFQHAMHAVTAEALLQRLRYKLLMSLQELRAGVFGIDRYATEFWVASHPTVRPCDFSQVAPPHPAKPDMTDQFLQWLRHMGDVPASYQQPLQASWFVPRAPHFALPLPASLDVVKFPDVRLREYFLLAGNLFKWYFLYQQAPPLDSWVYQWFPDGDTWRQAVQEYGEDCVDVITTAALQEESASGRNRYTRDNTKKLKKTSTTTTNKVAAAAIPKPLVNQ